MTSVPELTRLEELAKAATPGPWKQVASVGNGDVYVRHSSGGHTLATSEQNAALIAACSPETILALVRAVRAAKVMHDNAVNHYMVAEDMYAFEMAMDELEPLRASQDLQEDGK